MTRWAVTVGNSTLLAVLFDEMTIVDEHRWRTDEFRNHGVASNELTAFLSGRGRGAVLCCVVPTVREVVMTAMRGADSDGILEVELSRHRPMPLLYRTPETLGADRYCAALAARELFGAPVIVIDCGTMLTVNVVDGDGYFIGGSIAPGIRTSMRVMHDRGMMLPEVDLAEPPSVIGRDTAESMRAGALHHSRCGLEGMLREIRRITGHDTPLCVTGGDASLLLSSGFEVERMKVDERLLSRGAILYLLLVHGC